MSGKTKHTGRLGQTGIYFRKFLRMFVYQNDWKVLPIGAVIAAVVAFVIGTDLFKTQEGTKSGIFALVCVCIWNGFFNSIQCVCREREIVKREHRAGLHMSSYVSAQMIYQFLLCTAQTVITIAICMIAGIKIPAAGIITPLGIIDTGITFLLVTYAADMMALAVSCIVRNTTTAMTAMPFMLIFQLVFSGGIFKLSGIATKVQYLTISHWGMSGMCGIGRYNEQPMMSVWTMLKKFKNVVVDGETPFLDIVNDMEATGSYKDLIKWAGKQNQSATYASTVSNILLTWGILLLLIVVFAAVAVTALEFIDKDKR